MAIYESTKRKEYIDRLNLTFAICSSNTEEAMRKLIIAKKRLEKAEQEYSDRRKSKEKVEAQIRDFYGGLEGNVKNY